MACSKLWKEKTSGMKIQTCLWELLVCSSYSSILLVVSFYTDADKAALDNKMKVTQEQLGTFLDVCWTKYVKAKIEPGLFPLQCSPDLYSTTSFNRLNRRGGWRTIDR